MNPVAIILNKPFREVKPNSELNVRDMAQETALPKNSDLVSAKDRPLLSVPLPNRDLLTAAFNVKTSSIQSIVQPHILSTTSDAINVPFSLALPVVSFPRLQQLTSSASSKAHDRPQLTLCMPKSNAQHLILCLLQHQQQQQQQQQNSAIKITNPHLNQLLLNSNSSSQTRPSNSSTNVRPVTFLSSGGGGGGDKVLLMQANSQKSLQQLFALQQMLDANSKVPTAATPVIPGPLSVTSDNSCNNNNKNFNKNNNNHALIKSDVPLEKLRVPSQGLMKCCTTSNDMNKSCAGVVRCNHWTAKNHQNAGNKTKASKLAGRDRTAAAPLSGVGGFGRNPPDPIVGDGRKVAGGSSSVLPVLLSQTSAEFGTFGAHVSNSQFAEISSDKSCSPPPHNNNRWWRMNEEEEEEEEDADEDEVDRSLFPVLTSTKIREAKLKCLIKKEVRRFLNSRRTHLTRLRAEKRLGCSSSFSRDGKRSVVAEDAIKTGGKEGVILEDVWRKINSAQVRPRSNVRPCLHQSDDDPPCLAPALPYTNHCIRHIMYSVDQQLYNYCTGRCPNNVQCCVPVLNIRSGAPLCRSHIFQEPKQSPPVDLSGGSEFFCKKPKKKCRTLRKPVKKKRKKRKLCDSSEEFVSSRDVERSSMKSEEDFISIMDEADHSQSIICSEDLRASAFDFHGEMVSDNFCRSSFDEVISGDFLRDFDLHGEVSTCFMEGPEIQDVFGRLPVEVFDFVPSS